jgi:hypothetical protein
VTTEFVLTMFLTARACR